MSDRAQDNCAGRLSDPTMNPNPITPVRALSSDLARSQKPRSMTDRTSTKFPLDPTSGQTLEGCEEILLDKMSDQVEQIVNFHNWMSVWIRGLLAEVEFFNPPATHLIATIEESVDDGYDDEHNKTVPAFNLI